ncbi:MAG: (d)CMP kinase [Deltaproteobacteria bacterium]|nr:(d)CMP kinase [Deltaproteobacteria bacterium]
MRLITLDGPAGSGKSSVAKEAARQLGYYFLSTGLIYRALGWHLDRMGWDGERSVNPAWVAGFTLGVDSHGGVRVNGVVVEENLHGERFSRLASLVSALPLVRGESNRIQRELAQQIEREGSFPGMIVEGRDSGTVVFPQARPKFFITASPRKRAQRRLADLRATDPTATLESVQAGIEARDQRDATRDVAPLRPADDAEIILTDSLTLAQVVALVIRRVRETAEK